MTTSLKTLNRKRGNIQAQLTKLISKDLENVQTTELRVIMDSLEDIKNKFEGVKQEYYQIATDEEFQIVDDILKKMDDDIQEFQVSTKLLLYKSIEDEKSNVIFKNNNSNVESNIRLPEIPLPHFDGQFNNWNSFKQQFQNLIYNNPSLSDSQKFYYLNASLKGAAKQVQSPNDNYDSLFKALTLRYENTKLIVDCHIQNIINYKPITKENPTELRMLIDTLQKNIRALKALEFERNNFVDILLINLVCAKLDKETHRQFQLSIDSHEVPTWDIFINFLEKRYQILENLKAASFDIKPKFSNPSDNKGKNSFPYNKSKSLLIKNASQYCIFCDLNHSLYKCQSFLKMDVNDRFEFCKSKNLCLNCLNSSHKLYDCISKSRCIECNKKHHSLLHKPQSFSKLIHHPSNSINNSGNTHLTSSLPSPHQTPIENEEFSCAGGKGEDMIQNFISQSKQTHVLLSTALIYVKDIRGEFKRCRALLDSASQASFITNNCATFLGLKRNKINVPVGGLNGSMVSVGQLVNTVISSKNKEYMSDIEFLVVPKITDSTPSQKLDIRNLQLPSGVTLADSRFFEPSKIDILLGAQTFFEILKPSQIRVSQQILLQNTYFGYLVTGSVQGNNLSKTHCHLIIEDINLDKTLRSFWEIESLPEKVHISDELKYCMEHFNATHTRDNGRYVVQMPTKQETIELGLSRDLAIRRLNSTMIRLEKNPNVKELYRDFLKEYENLGHMEEVREDVLPNPHYYIPHQAVLRPDKITSKIRVVFNASSKTSNGMSLNDLLLKGGTVQNELFSTLLRFRKHIVAFTADVEKMYRQIKIHPSQQDLLRIVWKDEICADVKTYRLTTVTYGTTCAPFLATRTLIQLAEDEKDNFPLASPIVKSDFYIDDVLSGAPDVDTALKIQQQLLDMLKAGGMHLYKWSSNSKELLSHVSTDDQEYVFKNDENMSVKTLGMSWNPGKDTFHFTSNSEMPSALTKRTALSIIAKLYDPLGLVGPLMVKAKLFIQKLWLLGLPWDEEVPTKERIEFQDFIRNLQNIDKLTIPRCVMQKEKIQVEIHAFSDSSEQAYGACVYIRTKDRFNNLSVHLLTSKSRIAPVKRVTLPRLELLGAVLLSKLVNMVLEAMQLEVDAVHLYTDSTIVLSWIRTSPHLLKCFVANRVIQITDLTSTFEWHHITSKENPADPLSRGLSTDELFNSKIWWFGPDFLHCDLNFEANYDCANNNDPAYTRELKPVVNNYAQLIVHSDFFDNFYKLSNNYIKLIRILSFIFRFISKLQKKFVFDQFISCGELSNARDTLVKHAQAQDLATEISALKQGKSVSNQSKLKFLNPFLDKNQILRVGGRLINSKLNENAKHPIILPKGHKLTTLILEYFHRKFLHVGPNSLLHLVRQEFWPINGRNQCRQIVHNCVTCFKNKPILASQIMGNLPKERVTETFPFYHTGVDYCGPFLVKYKNQRKGNLNKIYVAVFVCLATRAIHLEIVSELSSDAFIATLKRFFSRRGKCAKIFSDNATYFVKTSKELKKLHSYLMQPNEEIANYLSIEGVDWKFIPPKSPNFGGIWEAGVKSFKFHLKRSIGKLNLTIEEFLTITVQIEGILNSRPLIPLSAEADEFDVLTPSHFLIGRAISAIPETDLVSIENNRLDKYRKISKTVQNIWKSWKKDYLNNLQSRSKWQFDKANVEPNAVVLVKEDNLPIAHWIIGKIVETYPGADGKIRVCKLKLGNGNFVKRPISKIAILPSVNI